MILGLLMPQVSIILAGASIVLEQGAATAEASATSGVEAALASLPSIVPFSVSASSLLNFYPSAPHAGLDKLWHK